MEHVRMTIKEIFLKKKKDLVGKAEVFALALVSDNLDADPHATQTEIFEKVKKKTALPIGGAGISIYRNPPGNIPETLDFKILVMESDKRVRNSGETLSSVVQSEEFKKIKKAAIKAAVAQPHVAVASVAVSGALKVITKAFKMNKDDQLILVEGSFDRAFDELGAKHGEIMQESKYVKVTYQVEVV